MNKNVNLTFMLSICLLLLNCSGSIQGTVTDDHNDNPIEDAEVSINRLFTLSGSDGFYRLMGVPFGMATVEVNKEGYEKFSAEIDVIEDETTQLDIQLQDSRYVQLQGCWKSNLCYSVQNSAQQFNLKSVFTFNPDNSIVTDVETYETGACTQSTGIRDEPSLYQSYEIEETYENENGIMVNNIQFDDSKWALYSISTTDELCFNVGFITVSDSHLLFNTAISTDNIPEFLDTVNCFNRCN